MTLEELEKKKSTLFDDSFNHKSDNADDVKDFCKALRDETGVQVCNNAGGTYEYLPQVYRSVVKKCEV